MYSKDTLKCEVQMVTPTQARQLRDACHYERQRPLSGLHIGRLQTEIAAGRFIQGTQVHFGVLGGKPYIVNGNHTLEAVAVGTTAVPLTFLYTRVADEDELAAIYSRHDIGKARTWSDAIRAHNLYDGLGSTKLLVDAFGTAVGIILSGFVQARVRGRRKGGASDFENHTILVSRDLRVAAMNDYRDYFAMYTSCLKGAGMQATIRLRRGAVMAVALETLRYQPSLAAEFWANIAQDDGLAKLDPRKTLLRHLIDNTTKGVSIETQARQVASAWNAFFREEKELHHIRAGLEFKLAGTPWGAAKKTVAIKQAPTLKLGVKANGGAEALVEF